MVEFQPSKLAVVGSNPIARSNFSLRTKSDLKPRQGDAKGVFPPPVPTLISELEPGMPNGYEKGNGFGVEPT